MATMVGGRSPLLMILLPALTVLAVAPSGGGAPGASAASAPPPGLVFHVGGPRGWRVPDARTNYGWWAMENRFRIGDQLYFKYANDDSVLLVNREAFDACNATDPVAAFYDGATTFRLDRPGFFCFISAKPGHCEEGQRLVVRVMAHHAAAAAPGPAEGPAVAGQPGHGGYAGGGGGPGRSGSRGASSGSAGMGVAAAVVTAAAAVVFGTLVLMFL